MYQTYSMTIFTEAIDSAIVSLSRVHLSSLIGISLLVKAMAPEETLVVVSKVVTLAVQTLESVKAWCTSYSHLSRGIKLGIDLATPSQQSVVLNSMKAITFLTFSTLSATGMYKISPASAIATLGYSRVYSSLFDHSSMAPKIEYG